MDTYMLIFRHQDGDFKASPEQMELWMIKAVEWINTIKAQDKYVDGNGLPFQDARVIRATRSDVVITNGPFGEIKETIGGYIIVKAASPDEAVAFAKACPVLLEEGNSVEIRKISGSDKS